MSGFPVLSPIQAINPITIWHQLLLPSFEKDKRLHPVKTLKVYEERIASFCDSSGKNQVFRSFIGKHGPVTSSTIARWIKHVCKKQGLTLLNLKHILPGQRLQQRQLCLV